MKVYQHYKGGVYAVITTEGTNTVNDEKITIYVNLNKEYFSRPTKEFFEFVNLEEEEMLVRRFTEVFDDSTQKFFKDPF